MKQGTHLYEYAVLRLVPKVEREEFLNIGVILYCRDLRFLGSRFPSNEERWVSFAGEELVSKIKPFLQAIHLICEGCDGSGPIGQLDSASRFRWLTSPRSTVLQTSRVHPGLCEDPKEELERLLGKLTE